MDIIRSVFAVVRIHWKLSVALMVVFIGGGYYYVSSSSEQQASPATVTKIEAVKRGDLRVSVSGSGQVEAVSQVDLTPVIAGDGIDVMRVLVKNNQEVKKGPVIAVLDTEDALRDIESAELNLRSAELKMKQVKDQYDNETKDDLWQRQTQDVSVKQSLNNLNKAKEKLQDYSIKAPFDGVVTGLSVEAGDSVSRSTVIASVITRDMLVTVSLNEVDAAKVAEGNSVTLSFDALPELSLSGKVSRIDTIGSVTQNVVSYNAEIIFDEQLTSLKPGMSASADIAVVEKTGVLLVPNAALSTSRGKTIVRTQQESRAVVTGVTDDASTEIVSGLSEGENILIETRAAAARPETTTNVFNSLFRGQGQQRNR